MRSRSKKDIMIVALLVVVVFMTVGYSVLASNLEINGTAFIVPNTWKVEFENVATKATSGDVTATDPTFTVSTVTFDVTLKSPGDSVSYDIIIANNGALDAELKEIVKLPLVDASSALVHNFTGITPGEILKIGEKKTVTISIAYSEDAEPVENQIVEQISYSLNFKQYTE